MAREDNLMILMMSVLMAWCRRANRFMQSVNANTAITFALALPAILACAGVAVDYATISRKQSALQSVADAAAIAAAKELPLANSNPTIITESGKAFIAANVSGKTSLKGSVFKSDIQVVDKFTGVEVTLEEHWKPFFAHFISDKVTPIVAKAKANILGEGLVCIVGLVEKTYAGIHMDNRASIDARDCGVYSNSPIFASIRLDSHSTIKARSVCTVGGYFAFGRGTSISPSPVTDCPAIDDPLASRTPPPVGACDFNGFEVGKGVEIPAQSVGDRELVVGFREKFKAYSRRNPVPGSPSYVALSNFTNVTLQPGVYCNGLFIGENQNVTLLPGVYVIKDGPFVVSGNARVKGDGVGFYLTGKDSVFDFQADTTIDLVAPRTGTMAGLLIFEDRNVPHGTRFNPFNLSNLPSNMRLHRIRSNNARQLLGTIYTPHAILMIDADTPVADRSAYTAIIAWRVWLREGPSLHLNADYKSTDVPVPSSLVGGRIVLSK